MPTPEEVRPRGGEFGELPSEFPDAHVVIAHQFPDGPAVRGSEAIKFENAGHAIPVFDAGQPTMRDYVLQVVLFGGDGHAAVLDLADRKAETAAQFLKLRARRARGIAGLHCLA